MKLVLSHTTALDLLRAHRCGAPFQLMRTQATSLADSAHTRTQIAQFEIPSFPRLDSRIHVLVPKASMLSDSSIHESHLITSPLTPGSLARVDDGVFVASPALVFLQHGAQFSWLDLALLGAEFCGKYSLPPAGQGGMRKCAPIADAHTLAVFLDKMADARGARTARQALEWLPELAASPMESALYLLLCLSSRRGGYGLPRPDMNPPTPLGSRNSHIMQVDELHCDLHWTDAHVALEYNSKDSHIGQLTHDALRANALTSEGEQVFTMTPAILANPDRCDALIGQIAEKLGHRLRGNALGMSPKRRELRARLFPWVS